MDEDYEYPCSSCERLHKKVITKYTADTKKFDSAKWEQLKQYLPERDDDFDSKIIIFVNIAGLCLMTTSFQLRVSLKACMLKKF